MRIIKLQSENVKKLKAVEITPKADVVIISGKNDQGKTSVLDSIWYALQGKTGLKSTPMPIRKGEKRASVTLTLDDFVVTRTWTSDDKSYLKVTNREGLTYNSPQELLDGFIGELTFNPLEFAQMKDRDQRQLLLKLANIDIDQYDEIIVKLKEDRRIQGQKIKLYEGERDTRDFKGIPTKEISISGLQFHLEEAIDHNRDVDAAEHNMKNTQESMQTAQQRITDLQAEIAKIELGIRIYEKEIKTDREFLQGNKKVDIEVIRAQINEAMEHNELVQAKNRNVQTDKKRDVAQAVYDDYTDRINMQLQGKEVALRNAQMPIEGLGITDTGVMYFEIPFGQLSSSEQLKVSLAMAMALNPKLRVIRITDGSLLDDDNMKVIKSMAKDNDFQVWIERVSDTGELCFIIEDGEIING